MREILLMIGLSISLFAELSKSENIVTDSRTGLQWQDNATPATMNWNSAIDYCEALILEQHTDWRLPNIRELTSIMDDTKTNPSIDITVFVNIQPNRYWSSSTVVKYPDYVTNVYFGDGSVVPDDKRSDYYVRCVREE